MNNELYLTQEQLNELKEEYQYYVHTKRPEVVERIKEAKSFGDLSENSEYDSAREEQSFVEAKIKELDTIISNAIIMDEVVDSDTVVLGTTVTYEDTVSKEKHTYKIVGVGANPLDKNAPSISTNTPVARALLGAKVGDIVTIEAPMGNQEVKVKKIQ